jgi:hypothetical protein
MQVFISHSKKDETLVRKLVDQLKAEGLAVWYSADEILPGDNWAKKFDQAMTTSDAAVFVLSPGASESEWFQRQLDYVLGSARYKNRVITLVTDRKADVPWILQRFPVIAVDKRNAAKTAKRVAAELVEEAAK